MSSGPPILVRIGDIDLTVETVAGVAGEANLKVTLGYDTGGEAAGGNDRSAVGI